MTETHIHAAAAAAAVLASHGGFDPDIDRPRDARAHARRPTAVPPLIQRFYGGSLIKSFSRRPAYARHRPFAIDSAQSSHPLTDDTHSRGVFRNLLMGYPKPYPLIAPSQPVPTTLCRAYMSCIR